MSTLASLLIELGIDTGRLEGDLGKANRKVETSFAGMSASASKLGAAFGAIAASGIVLSLDRAAHAAMEGEQAINRLDAVIRATGNATGFTRDQLQGLADSMAETTQFDDESIRNATASLLKFGNVHGQVLEKALKLSADYAAFTGTDMTSASETLGRAIASPAQGIERLQRSIGYLNPAQVEAIKNMQEMGDLAGAQSAIMAILEQKIGGVAEAMNTGYTKAFNDAKKAGGEFWESLGNAAPVQAAVQSFLGFTTESLRDMKHIIEDGDWVQALKFVMGFRQTDEQVAARRPKAPAAPGGTADAQAELERQKAFKKSLDKQDEELIQGALKRKKKALEEEQKQRYEAAQAMLAADEMFAKDYAEAWYWANKYVLDEEAKALRERLELGQIYTKQQEMDAETTREAWHYYFKFLENQRAKAMEEAGVQWGGFLQGIDDGFRSMWDAMVEGGANAGQVLRETLKRTFFDWLYQQFAKPIILNVVAGFANSMGLSGLGSLATTAAGGAGGGLNLLGSLSSLLPSGAVGSAFASGASSLAGFLGAGSGLASSIGSFASFLPGIGTAIGVASLLYSAFNDGPENPNYRWLQGTGGQGLFGGISTEGNYGFDSTGLNRVIGGLDQRFARILGPSGVAAATSGLAGYTQAGLRMDGQPAQFAFPEGTDREAAEQLAKELLQSRYGIIFDQIDKTIADTIKGWSGTSTELQTYIETALGVIEGLAGLNITGLNVSTLQAMQREGEGLGETFTRVAGQWGQFNEMFTTEAERLAAAQNQVTSTFANLGIAIPSSNEEFAKLVRGLDLSTEAGRNMFNALMQVAPAFNTVSQASAALVNDFNSIMVQLRGQSYQSTLDAAQLEQATRQFMALNSWASGMDWRYVAQQILTITPEDYAAYGRLGNGSQSLINDILRLQIPRQGSTSSYTPVSYTPTGYDDSARALEELRRAAEEAAAALQNAKDGIREWLAGVLLSDLSPLDPASRLDFAQNAYVENLMKAQGGDLGAISNYTNLADAYLKEARSYYASSPEYTSIFAAVTEQAGKLAGLQEARPLTAADSAKNTASIVQAIEDLKAEVARLNRDQSRAVADQTRTLGPIFVPDYNF